jgi:hypothetical protein
MLNSPRVARPSWASRTASSSSRPMSAGPYKFTTGMVN